MKAAHVIHKERNDQIAPLECTSAYPALSEEINLRTIPHLSQMGDVPVGLSDHSLGIATPVAAVALSACIVEKHFTLSRQMPSPDRVFSLEPYEFKAMVEVIRETEKVLGRVCYEVSEYETASRVFRRSLLVVKDMKNGGLFNEENVWSIRPGYGLFLRYLSEILGRFVFRQKTHLAWHTIELVARYGSLIEHLSTKNG